MARYDSGTHVAGVREIAQKREQKTEATQR
ncbi:MAG: hypothetical protein RIR25_2082, partial [Verrucomicrobiota bacterium]